MKLRSGFVSNSSSSSFVVAAKGVHMTKEGLKQALGIVPGTPVDDAFEPVLDVMLSGRELTLEQLAYDRGYDVDKLDDIYGEEAELIRNGWRLREFDVDRNETEFWCKISEALDRNKRAKVRLVYTGG